jgi:hypothetical protein
MSAMGHKADITAAMELVRFVPLADFTRNVPGGFLVRGSPIHNRRADRGFPHRAAASEWVLRGLSKRRGGDA